MKNTTYLIKIYTRINYKYEAEIQISKLEVKVKIYKIEQKLKSMRTA